MALTDFQKSITKTKFADEGGYNYYDEQKFTNRNFWRPIENGISRIVAGSEVDERNVLKLVKAMMKDPAGFETTVKDML